jgi:general secretion pathway protein C
MSLNRVAVWTANAALAVLCCWIVAGIGSNVAGAMLAPAAPAEAAPLPAVAASQRTWKEREVILHRNLFNSSLLDQGAGTAEPIIRTKLPLKLLGTAAGGDPKNSWAAVEDLEKRQHLVVRVADRLQGKAEVMRIERRRIVLRNGGSLEELSLDSEEAAGGGKAGVRTASASSRGRNYRRGAAMAAAPSPPPADTSSGNSPVERVQRLADDRFGVSRDDVQSVANNPAALFSQARILPKYEEGQMVGVQLNSIQQGSLFEQIGIQNGDIITEFNGIHITNQQDSAAVLRQLTEASEFNVTVQGADGQPRRLTYELR